MILSSRVALGAAAIAALMSTSVAAQTVFTGSNAAEDRNEDLADAIEDDAERDLDRFGNEGRPEGFTGSFSLRGISSIGNTDSYDIGIGADLNYRQGVNGYQLQLNYAAGSDDGEVNEESLYYDFEYTRDLTPQWFGFGKVQGSVDEFSDFETDTFVSFGAGYRIYNEPGLQWSVQAGPGYRFAELSDASLSDLDEGAFGISSDYAHKLNETWFVTNDTDVIYSDSDTVVFNDLALNASISRSLALRTSLLTEFHTDPSDGFEDTDHTFGVSLVYSFN